MSTGVPTAAKGGACRRAQKGGVREMRNGSFRRTTHAPTLTPTHPHPHPQTHTHTKTHTPVFLLRIMENLNFISLPNLGI